MKTKQLTMGIAIVAIAVTSILSSCKKKDTQAEAIDSDTSTATDQSLASTSVNDLTSISDEVGRSGNLSSFKTSESTAILSSSCTTISSNTLTSAKTITVNFGTVNCLCNDGRNRRGSVIMNFTGNYRDSLTVITVTPSNYFVNDNQVTGTKSITNKGHNAANHLVYEIYANVSIIKANGGGTITWTSTRQREWTYGESSPTDWTDDLYSITGGASGTTANGNTFTSVITSPLIRNMASGCRRHFTQGTLEHTPGGKAARIIDYGNGACDDQATVTIKGKVYNITLP